MTINNTKLSQLEKIFKNVYCFTVYFNDLKYIRLLNLTRFM